MSSVERRSALTGHRGDGDGDASGDSADRVMLEELELAAIAQINGAPDKRSLQRLLAPNETVEVGRAARGDTYVMLWNGPGKWLTVSESEEPYTFIADLRDKLEGTDATVTDLSHARTVIRITGKHAPDVLCKGCPADIEAMQSGECLATLMGTLSSVVHCREAGQTFDVYVFRSFGQSFWEWLTDASLEYGYAANTRAD